VVLNQVPILYPPQMNTRPFSVIIANAYIPTGREGDGVQALVATVYRMQVAM